MVTSIPSNNQVSMLEIISDTKEGDDVIRALTEGPGPFLTKETITLEQYQILIEMLMTEVDRKGKEENAGETVEKGSYTIIDPDQRVYKFLRGYHEKVQEAEKRRAEEGGCRYFIRRLLEVPRSYSRNPKLGKSSHYKKCPDQYGIDFRDRKGKLKSILPPDRNNPNRPRMTHLLFGDLSPMLAYGQTPAVFLKMETVGIGKTDEKLNHLFNFIKSRPPIAFLRKVLGRKRTIKSASSRKESHIDKKIKAEYKRILKEFEANLKVIDASHHAKLLQIIKSNPKSIQAMLRNLMFFEKLSKNKKGRRFFIKKINRFKKKLKKIRNSKKEIRDSEKKIKDYKKETVSYRQGDEVILDLRPPVAVKKDEKNDMEERAERIIQFFGENKDVGFVKSVLSNSAMSEYHKNISEKLGLVYNVIRMKDKDGKELLVEVREKLGFGGFGTAYKAVVISGENKGKVFALKQQRLPSLARTDFFSRLKQVIKRPFMEAPNEEMETDILKSQGMFFGEAYINYKGDKKGSVAEGIETQPDSRPHQLGAEKTQSRYYVLQPLMDGGDFSHLRSNRGKEGKRSWDSLTIEESTALVSSAISSLLALHASGYAHNDLHHENIMTTADPPRAYVMDFGRATKENIYEHAAKESNFTKAQIADIQMMMNGKAGKPGSLFEVFELMIVRISESDLETEEKNKATDIVNTIQTRISGIKEGAHIISNKDDIAALFKLLNKSLKPKAPSIQAIHLSGP